MTERTGLGDGKPRLDVAADVAWRSKQAARVLRARETPAEKVMWDALRARRFMGLKFRRQQSIGPFVVDFYCAEQRLVVEVDGNIHADDEHRANDVSRQRAIESADIRVIRVSNDLVLTNLPAALEAIRDAIQDQTSTQAPLSP